MDADALLQGGGLIVSGAALATIVNALVKVWTARNQRTTVAPQPLEVKGAPQFVTCEQCELRHREVDNRLAAGTRAFDAVRSKIDAVETKMDTNQRDVMQSLQKLSDRVSPMAETCAENGAAIRILLGENLKERTKQ